MGRHQCFTHAAAISFYSIVSVFPLLLLVIGILGFFLEEENTQNQVMALAGRYFPAGSLRFVRENIRSVVEARDSLSFFSLAGLLWSATLMFEAIHNAVNQAWADTRTPGFVASKLKSLFVASIVTLFVVCSTLLTTQVAIVPRLESFLSDIPWGQWGWRLGTGAAAVVDWLVPVALNVAAFVLCYRFLPRAAVRLADVWPAGLAAALIWEISKRVFVWYVTRFTDYGQVYGSINALLVFLLWTYGSALILIWGAEFAAGCAREKWAETPSRG